VVENTRGKEQRVRQNLPAEGEAKGIVVVVDTWCSLSGLLEYIGRFWLSESVEYTCSLHLFVSWLRWKEFDKSVVEHAMEERGLRAQLQTLLWNFCFSDCHHTGLSWQNDKSDVLHSPRVWNHENQQTSWHILWHKNSFKLVTRI
jgi:hypothetical protein